MVSNCFVRKTYTVSFESSANEVWDIMTRFNERYVFVTDPKSENKYVAYIRNTDMLPLLTEPGWMDKPVRELPYQTNLAYYQQGISISDYFQVFGEEVVVVRDPAGQDEGYLRREDVLYYILTNQSGHPDWMRSLLNSIPMGI
ncbi:CBS domain-containing protein, partial [Mesorhizobium sp. M00.F.Ca.ET.186.01.1.1]